MLYIEFLMIELLLLYALFSSSFPVSKVLLNYTSPMMLTGLRMIGGGIVLLGYQMIVNHKHLYLKRKHWFLFAQLTFFGIYITYLLRFWALSQISVAKTAFFYNLSPFFSAIYSYFLFDEKISKKQWVGLGIGFIGLIPLIITGTPGEKEMGEFLFVSWAELALFVSVACHSYSWTLTRKLVRFKRYSPAIVNGISMFAGGALALFTAWLYPCSFYVENIARFTGLLAFIIIVNNVVCYNIYAHLLRKYTSTFLSFAGFSSPLFTAFYGWVFLGEFISYHFFISSIIVFVGLYLFYQDELKKQGS